MTTLPAIRHTFTLNIPIDRVWNAIATSEGLDAWLMPNNFVPLIGGKFQFQSTPMGPWDGVVHCRVLDLKKPRRLVISWRVLADYETKLSFGLEEKDGQTQVTITHDGWDNIPFELIGVRNMLELGWKQHAQQQLAEYLEEHK